MASVSPWPWRRVQNADGTASVFAADGALVCIVHNGDSALIVAAPEMLDALKAAEELHQVGVMYASQGLLRRVQDSRRAAIAKAEAR